MLKLRGGILLKNRTYALTCWQLFKRFQKIVLVLDRCPLKICIVFGRVPVVTTYLQIMLAANLQSVRKRAVRFKIRSPCMRCLALKKRCSDDRPCASCIKANRSGECTAIQDFERRFGAASECSATAVERPLPFLTSSIYRAHDSLLIKHIADVGWGHAAVRRFCSIGFQPDVFTEAIYHLAPHVKREIGDFFLNLQSTVSRARTAYPGNLVDLLESGPGSKESPRWLLEGRESFSEMAAGCGQLVVGIDAASQTCRDVCVNSHIADLFQMHRWLKGPARKGVKR